jgi:signal transduction histidine kinase
MQGSMAASSEVGVGTTFTIQLPAAVQPAVSGDNN